jgi:hypothetical protein
MTFDRQTQWVARIIPLPGNNVDALLSMPLGLDVWERHANMLVAVGNEAQLSEIERRHLAWVERLSTVADFQARSQ